TSGDISVMLISFEAAQQSQDILLRGWEVQTTGNPMAHAILRGYVDSIGNSLPNYPYEHLQRLYEAYGK
ncbi:3-deoxy-7-phosphoheptulonate synthase, partial [Megasphaera massiliensis]|nr:3-deoxy-7-phosphoheptulonate synthase [Megasphaera massiliensis]